MTHKEFCIKWLGKNVEFDGVYLHQCVDLVRFYCQERGYPIGGFGGSAIKGWKTGSPFNSKWERVEYKPGMYPPQGAVLFWSEKRCKNGHTGIANKFCNPLLLRCIDQNGTGKRDPIKSRWYTYRNLLGWYKLK